jgi:hypothetical protein
MLIANRNGADPGSMGNVYHGAWAWPESCTCCGTSLSYNQYTAAPTILRYAVLADDDLFYEIARRMMIMATYDSNENGVVKDGLLGQAVATGEWSNLAHPWPLCQVVEGLAWAPELFGPKRENHIMRSTSVVNSVVYAKNEITYSTFDAPFSTIDVIRLAFKPTAITADGSLLSLQPDLHNNGYTLKPLKEGDWIVQIRHDMAKDIVVKGVDDPQQQIDDSEIKYQGSWEEKKNDSAFGGKFHLTSDKEASLGYTFTGNQIRVLGCVGEAGGLADVYLDGKKQSTLIDCWNPKQRCKQLLYSRSGLDNSKHEIKISAQGKGNLISKGANIYIDALQYSDAVADSNFGRGGGPTGAQRMIFGYTGRQDYIDSKGNAWKPATEWVIRSGYGTDTVEKAWWTHRRSMYIGKTIDEELYRYGVHGKEFWSNITVAPGKYYVLLKFAETPLHTFLERNKDGGRITHTFDVTINGRKVMDKVNITKAAGGIFKAYDRVFTDIEPKNGVIEVWFVGCDDQEAMVQAMEIGPMSEYFGADK